MIENKFENFLCNIAVSEKCITFVRLFDGLIIKIKQCG
jgi:hypothetical protein